MSKESQVVQGFPAAFLEYLLDAYQTYTPIDPRLRRTEGIRVAFVSQSAPDLHKKTQKTEAFEGKNT